MELTGFLFVSLRTSRQKAGVPKPENTGPAFSARPDVTRHICTLRTTLQQARALFPVQTWFCLLIKS